MIGAWSGFLPRTRGHAVLVDTRRSVNPLIKDRRSPLEPAGENDGTWLAVPEQGAHLLQDTTRLNGFHVILPGSRNAADRRRPRRGRRRLAHQPSP
jgi:hypothetical protein